MVQRIILAALSALIYISTLIPQCALAGWEIPFDGSNSEPVVHDEIIYVGSFDGAVYAIEPKSGEQIWRFQTGTGLTSGPEIIMAPGKTFGDQLGAALNALEKKGKGKREIDATPVIKDGTVYVGSKDHNFYALDAKTGKLRWATNIEHQISRKALVTDKTILVRGGGEGLLPAIYALDKEDGRVIWSTVGKGEATYPSVSGNVVYYGLKEPVPAARDMATLRKSYSYDNITVSINAVELRTGTLLWTQKFQGKPPEEIVISSDLVYVSFFLGGGLIELPNNVVDWAPSTMDVFALRASSGEIAWKFSAGPVRPSGPLELVAGSEHIYFVAPQGLHAVNIKTGKQEWFIKGTFSHHQMAIGEYLYVHGDSTRNDSHLYAIDTKTGRVIWSYSDKNLFYTTLVGDTLYISAEQSLVALNASTGKHLWKFKTGGFFKAGTNVSTSPTIHDNHVIFPTSTNMIWGKDSIQGHLYSVDARTGKVK